MSWQPSIPSLKIQVQCVLKLLIRQGFELHCHCNLDLWPRNPKHNRGNLLIMTNLHTKFEDPRSMDLKLLMGQGFELHCHCNLDLWPRKSKHNRGNLLIMTNLHTKFEDPRSMCSLVIDRSRFWATMSMWPWPWSRNSKFNRGHLLVMTNHHTKLEDPWAMSSLVIDRTRFVYGPRDRPTDRRTDICKAIYMYPHFFEGGIIGEINIRNLKYNLK